MPTPSSLGKSHVLKSITWDPFKVINNLLDVINQPHSPDLSPTLGFRWKADKFGCHLSLGWTFFLELTKWHPAFSGSENTVYFVFSDSGVPVKVTLQEWSGEFSPVWAGFPIAWGWLDFGLWLNHLLRLKTHNSVLLGSPDSRHQQPNMWVDESSDDSSPQLWSLPANNTIIIGRDNPSHYALSEVLTCRNCER